MWVLRLLAVLVGAVVALGGIGSAVRSVVLPRATPVRGARLAFLAVRVSLRFTSGLAARRGRSEARDTLLALQGPLGIFAQIATWTILVATGFTGILWAADAQPATLHGLRDAALESGSSISTLGTVHPVHVGVDFLAYVESGIGLVLLALAITYLPALYAAFSKREALMGKLALLAGAPPSPTQLVVHAHSLGGFDHLDVVWEAWEDWFVELGESHTSFSQLIFFRSLRSDASWVTSAAAVLDAAALTRHAIDAPARARAELVGAAGLEALELVSGFLGVPLSPEPTARPRAQFEGAVEEFAAAGIPVVADRAAAWEAFAKDRASYEPLLLTLASLADAVPTPWLPAEEFREHRPPLLGPLHTHHTVPDAA